MTKRRKTSRMPTPKRIRTTISHDVLDQIGKDFKFNHGKGVAEWLKNSLDAYIDRRVRSATLEPESGGWPVYLHLLDGPHLAVMDFAGACHRDVKDFLLNWFSTTAAARGGRAAGSSLTGGHGNGGKFYMRQMWRGNARFCTWLDGHISSLVVDDASDGTCGYWEYEDEDLPWRTALQVAFDGSGLSARQVEDFIAQIDPLMVEDLDAQRRGFTVVLGRRGEQILSANDVVRGRRWVREKLLDALRSAPASHRPLHELTVRVAHSGNLGVERLEPEHIEEDADWTPRRVDLPATLVAPGDSTSSIPLTTSETGPVGELVIRKAKSPLAGRRRGRNLVLVFDLDGNPVGSFPVQDLHAGSTDHTRFLFCELRVKFGEIEDHVENDRESFRDTPQIRALKEWLRQQLSACVDQLDEALREAERQRELRAAVRLNTMLNAYAQDFLRELESEVFIDWLDEEGGGEGGDRGEGESGGGRGQGSGGGSGEGGGRKDEPGTTRRVRRPRFPRILLSGSDLDPASADGSTRLLQPGHPPIYQNEMDLLHNVWWINTSHPYAGEALRRGGPRGHAWREYHLFMFRDVVQIEHMRLLQRHDAEIGLDQLENELLQRSSDFLSRLTQALAEEILE